MLTWTKKGSFMVEHGKRIVILGTRLHGEEADRWARLMDVVTERNPLLDKSKVLRDILFGDLNIVTEDERQSLRNSAELDSNGSVDVRVVETTKHEEIVDEKGRRRSPRKIRRSVG